MMAAEFQALLDAAVDAIVVIDERGQIITFNRAAERTFGYAAAHVLGKSVSILMDEPNRSEHGQYVARYVVSGEARIIGKGREVEARRANGDLFPVSLSVGEAVDGDKRRFVGIVRDLSEQRAAEQSARSLELKLAHVGRFNLMGEMAAGIAHEIRNPLASMSGSIQILRQELPLSEDQSQLMNIVLRESERLNETIRSFLSFARPQPLSMTRMDVRTAVSETARLLQNDAQLADTHEIAVDVPPTEVWFDGDESQIRQIVWNLATNGLRAMPDGGQLRLAARTDAASHEVVIGVHDQGVGIASEDMDGIFQPFRGGFARGTGLGLSIVHRIASDYGGEVRVTSEKGRGTSVEVALPVEQHTAGGRLTWQAL